MAAYDDAASGPDLYKSCDFPHGRLPHVCGWVSPPPSWLTESPSKTFLALIRRLDFILFAIYRFRGGLRQFTWCLWPGSTMPWNEKGP